MTDPSGWVLAGAAAVLLLQFSLWLVQEKQKNAGWADLGWAASIFIMSSVYFAAGPGHPSRKLLAFAMPLFWSTRLSGLLLRRLVLEKREDPRYQKMRAEKGEKASVFFLSFFIFQGFLAILLSLPFFIASLNPDPRLHPVEAGAFLLWAIALAGEAVADGQMRRFRQDPANRGKVCEAGLWNYSRHPNYFFECLIWVAFFLFASVSPGGGWAVVSPALMIFFLVKVSGVPPAEEQSLRSRGEAYRCYQETTSVLIPWFKGRAR